MKNYIKYLLYKAFISPIFYISILIFTFGIGISVFFIQHFFTSGYTLGTGAVFSTMPHLLSFLIPLLCFSNLSNKVQVPISSMQKIICEWIFIFILSFILIFFHTITVLCMSFFAFIDGGLWTTGTLLLLFYSMAVSALCIFFNSVFNSKSIALLASFLCTIGINCLSAFLLYVQKVPFLAEFIKNFSFSWHFNAAQKGVLDSRDLFFFLILSFCFVFSAIIVQELKKGIKFSKSQKKQILIFILIFVFLSLDSKLFFIKKDFTALKKYEISKYTKSLLKNTEQDITISYYQSSILSYLYPEAKDISDYLHEYCQEKNIHYKLFNADKKDYSTLLSNYGIYGRQIQTKKTNKTDFETVFSAIIIEYGETWNVIPFVLGTATLEYDLTSRIYTLIAKKPFTVNVIVGNGKSLNTDYSYALRWLNANGFVVNEINLDSSIAESIIHNCPTIILGSSSFTKFQIIDIKNIIEEKSGLFICSNSYNADIENAWYITESKNLLIDELSEYKIFSTGNIIADISCARLTMQSYQNEDGSETDTPFTKYIQYPLWISLLPQKEAEVGLTEFWAEEFTLLEDSSFKPILFTSHLAWRLEPDLYSKETLFQTNPFILEEDSTSFKNKEKSVFPIGFESKEYNVIFIPDQYFVNNLALQYIGGNTGDYRNLDFMVSSVLKLSGMEELCELQKKSTLNMSKAVPKLYEQNAIIHFQNIALFIQFILTPLIILFSFITFLIVRKNFNSKNSRSVR